MDILEEAGKVVEGNVREWDVKNILDMLGHGEYSFVFIVAKPDGTGTMVQQLSNTHPQAVYWMLSAAAAGVMQGEQGHDHEHED